MLKIFLRMNKKILKTTASDLLIEFGYEKDLNW